MDEAIRADVHPEMGKAREEDEVTDLEAGSGDVPTEVPKRERVMRQGRQPRLCIGPNDQACRVEARSPSEAVPGAVSV